MHFMKSVLISLLANFDYLNINSKKNNAISIQINSMTSRGSYAFKLIILRQDGNMIYFYFSEAFFCHVTSELVAQHDAL